MISLQDEDCRLLTVGSWYAMSGYGLAFTRNSKYLSMFNKRLLDLRSNGDLERLRRYLLFCVVFRPRFERMARVKYETWKGQIIIKSKC